MRKIVHQKLEKKEEILAQIKLNQLKSFFLRRTWCFFDSFLFGFFNFTGHPHTFHTLQAPIKFVTHKGVEVLALFVFFAMADTSMIILASCAKQRGPCIFRGR